MNFEDNPYYYPEKCGLIIFEHIDTADSYEYNKFVIWEKLDDGTLWWDTDSGCSCPSPFDNGDHGHDLKPITKETFYNFKEALKEHRDIPKSDYVDILTRVRHHLKKQEKK